MATEMENKKWKMFCEKRNTLIFDGLKKGLVQIYDEQLLEDLRHVYDGGLPISLKLLHEGFCNGQCYDTAPLVTLGFGDDDFKVIDAVIDELRFNPIYIEKQDENYFKHRFVERIKKDGTTWVYDTSMGLVFSKNLYYELENPKIINIFDKKTIQKYLYEDGQKNSDIEKDKYVLPFILPNIESYLFPTQVFYLEHLKREIKILKQELNYELLCQEIERDMLEKLNIGRS